MRTSRSVLNELKWKPGVDFSKIEVDYIHRGTPGDVATVKGSSIIKLGPWAMEILSLGKDVKSPQPGRPIIPYHRILRIRYDGKTVFDRKGDTNEQSG